MSSAHEWAAADPHRRAFAVLTEPLAVAMMAHLYPDKKPEERLATNDARCLACHTNPTLATATDPHAVALRSEGVSCEACHGNAGGWLGPHTGFTAQTRPTGYAAGGMAKLYDLGERALTCAGCHVGAPATDRLPLRDMNHDMIAAGHPRLNFDFATYQFLLPRHWQERDRATGATDPDFEARAWLVGRVAHAEAACRLTADRAKRSDPWPEFAEYSCVACHHRIADPKAAYPVSDAKRPGTLPWQPIWPVTTKVPALTDVATSMRGLRPAANTAELATKAADELKQLRAGLRGASAREWMTPLPDGPWDRDLTEQVYHAAAARERTRGPQADAAPFAAVAAKLRLPRGADGLQVGFQVAPETAAAVRALVK
jgi:hypothetical protein